MRNRRCQLLLVLIILTFILSSLLALQTNFSVNFSLQYDLSDEKPKGSISTEFRMNPSAFGREYDLSVSLKNADLESARLSLKMEGFKVELYKNISFVKTSDPVILYKIDSGRDGLNILTSDAKFVFSGDVMYAEAKIPYLQGMNLIVGKRNDKFDAAIHGFQKVAGLNVNYELIQQDLKDFNTKNAVALLSVAENNYNWGIRYLLAGATNTSLALSPQYIGNQNTFSAWYKFGSQPAFNTYVNTNFSFEKFSDDVLKNTEVGMDVNYGGAFVSLKKTGFADVTGAMPTEWGKFNISLGTTFSFMNFSGKFAYSFGKPAHNVVNTIGEVYYLELGRSFGNMNLFAKYQKIIGYYEEKDFFFGELKFTGFQNADFAIQLGNGDFAGDNPFKPVVAFKINAWW
ncbi:hypothetical protein [Fervidobacterium sp.]